MRLALTLSALLLLAGATSGCTSAQLSSSAGQIFCHIQTQGGGSLVVGLVDATATATSGSASPIVTPAVGLTAAAMQSYLNQQCALAATQVPGAVGSAGAVPAPAMPVQTVAVAPVPVPSATTPSVSP